MGKRKRKDSSIRILNQILVCSFLNNLTSYNCPKTVYTLQNLILCRNVMIRIFFFLYFIILFYFIFAFSDGHEVEFCTPCRI